MPLRRGLVLQMPPPQMDIPGMMGAAHLLRGRQVQVRRADDGRVSWARDFVTSCTRYHVEE